MNEDQIKYLVKQAHQIFSKTSIYEVMDLNLEAAIEALTEFYGPPNEQQLDQCSSILDQLRE